MSLREPSDAARPLGAGRLLGWLGAATADLLWPAFCAACEGERVYDGQLLCESCRPALAPLVPRKVCPRCAAPRSPDAISQGCRGCRDCAGLGSALARIHAGYEYGGPLADALLRLKWQGRDDLARPLGRLLATPLARCRSGIDLVVPVPLHPSRLRERGYNQAALLAQAALATLPRRLRPPLVHGALHRRRAAGPARDLSPALRRLRTRGAFFARPEKVAGQRVLLIDDVVTTGATALACAEALRDAGAERIEALCLLRAAL